MTFNHYDGTVTWWHRGVVLIAVFLPFRASAGVRFDFVVQNPTYAYSGRMWIDGTKSRTVITEGKHPLFNPNITIITRDEGIRLTVIDHSNHTYFERNLREVSGPLATVRGVGASKASHWRVTKSRSPTESQIVHVEYDLDMKVAGEKLAATVQMEAQFDVDPLIDQKALPWGLQYGAKTGFLKLDDAIAARVPDRLPLRQVVTASRQIAGGPVVTETQSVTVSNVVAETLPDGEFYAPRGYPYREPVFRFGE